MSKYFAAGNRPTDGRRPPKFAGTWYESNAEALDKQLTGYFKNAQDEMLAHPLDETFGDNRPVAGNILAAIVPHAGYAYSGQTAAFVYERLKGLQIKRVFLLGPSHYIAFRGAALPREAVFATPLGDLKVDQEVIAQLRHFTYFKDMPEVHAQEHSLEMQLPLIAKTFGDVKIVPIAVGTLADASDIYLFGHVLRRYIGSGDIVIVSSDFTHYGPRFEYQPFSENIAENIRRLDEDAFKCLENKDLKSFLNFHERTHDTICGFYPCSVLLSMLPPHTHGTLLRYCTSAQLVPEPDQNSVSYMAIIFSGQDRLANWGAPEGTSSGDSLLSQADGTALLKLARTVLQDSLQGIACDRAELFNNDQLAVFQENRGAFVTLFKHSDENPPSERKDGKNLRGCIGYVWPVKSLWEAVCDNVVSAATRDPRFQSVTYEELKDLSIEVSVLTPPRNIHFWQDIKLGKDGIVMYKNGCQAVFLPSVASDFGWDLPETLSQLSIKAGCGPDGWKHDALFDVFQAQSFEETH